MEPSLFLEACVIGCFDDIHTFATKANIVSRDSAGNSPLHLAAMNGQRGICAFLIREMMVSPDLTNTAGQTPWDLAKEKWKDCFCSLLTTDSATRLASPSSGSTSPNVPQKSQGRSRADTISPVLSVASSQASSGIPPDAQFESGVAKETDRELIRKAVKSLNVFDLLPPNLSSSNSSVPQDALLDSFECVTVEPGDTLILQGDFCDAFYVIASGKIGIFTKQLPALESSLRVTLESGCSFGDVPVLYGCKSPYSAVTESQCRLWFIRDVVLTNFLGIIAEEEYKKFTARAAPKKGKSSAQPKVETNNLFSMIFTRVQDANAQRRPSALNLGFMRFFRPRQYSNSSTMSSKEFGPTSPNLQTTSPSNLVVRRSSVKSRSRAVSDPPKLAEPFINLTRIRNDSDSAALGSGSVIVFKESSSFSSSPNELTELDELHASNGDLTHDPDLVFKPTHESGPPIIFSGTLEKLFRYLYVGNCLRDADFMRPFLMTFRMFTSSKAFFNHLLVAYDAEGRSPDGGLSDIQTNILTVLACWTCPTVAPRPFDIALFDNDPILDEISAFLDTLSDHPLRAMIKSHIHTGFRLTAEFRIHPIASGPWRVLVHILRRNDRADAGEYTVAPDTTLLQLLERICKETREKAAKKQNSIEATYDMLMTPGAFQFLAYGFCAPLKTELVISLNHIRQVILAPIKAYGAGLCASKRINPEYIAYQMSYLDHDSFVHIQERELIRKQWKNPEGSAEHIKAITNRFNQFCAWATTTILLEKDDQERVNVIAQLLRIGELFLTVYANFHGVFAVVSALSSLAISRLKNTWALIQHKDNEKLKVLNAYISGDNNRAAYRSLLTNVPVRYLDGQYSLRSRTSVYCCVPYLGIFLSDMLFTEEGNDDVVHVLTPDGSRDHINFIKYRRIGKVLDDIRKYQAAKFSKSKLDPLTQSAHNELAQTAVFLQNYQGFEEEEAWNRSVSLESVRGLDTAPKRPKKEKSGDFMWKITFDFGDLSSTSTIAEEPSSPTYIDPTADPLEISDEESIFRYHQNLVSVDYLGMLELKDDFQRFNYQIPGDLLDKMIKKLKKTNKDTARVSLDNRRDKSNLVIVDENKNAVIVVDFSKILHYEIYVKANVFYFVAPGNIDGNVMIHFFTTQPGVRHDVAGFYLSFNAQADRWSQSSVKQSETARQVAVMHLSGPLYGDGAFLVRESTSRQGAYALSLKYADEVTHFLIETNKDGSVQLKDAPQAFQNLQALIFHYSSVADGLPCTLQPEQCICMHRDFDFIIPGWFKDYMAKAATVEAVQKEMLPVPPIMHLEIPTEGSKVSHYARMSRESSVPEDPTPQLERQDWYFSHCDREQAEAMLLKEADIEGVFLVRPSFSESGKYVLSLIYEGEVQHVLVVPTKEGVSINETLLVNFKLVEAIQSCFQQSQSVLPCALSKPCSRPRDTATPVPELSPELEEPSIAATQMVEVLQISAGSYEISL